MCKSTKTTRSQAGHVNGCKGNLPGKVRAGRKEDKLKPKQLKRKIEKFVFQHELFLGDHPITPYELEQLTQSKNTAEILSLLTISSGDCLSCLKITPSQALSIPACDLVAPYARGIAFSKLAAVTYRLPTRQEWDEVVSFLRQQTHNAEVLKETLINSFSDAVVQKNQDLLPIARAAAEPGDARPDNDLLSEWFAESDNYTKLLKQYVYSYITE